MWQSPASILEKARIWAIVGNYGSGKTELSINLALEEASRGPTALVDLDIVNPFFRSAEQEGRVSTAGVRVLKPTFALSTVDIPALPAEITSVFGSGEKVFFDVGGDDTGAAALGRYKPQLELASAKMLFVINARRPLTGDADSILDLLARVCARARMEAFALCNNTNLGAETTIQDVLFGEKIVQEVALRANIAHLFHAAPAHLMDEVPGAMRPFTYPLTPYMRPDWL